MMTAYELTKHTDDCIKRALKGEAYCEPSVYDIKGFATPTQRRLISLLCHGIESYLEVGLYFGATFCAAVSNNPLMKVTGFEDWSQPFGENDVENKFHESAHLHVNPQCCQIVFDDFFNPIKPELDFAPFDFFYYDGSHTRDAQMRALPFAFEWMAKHFLFMVDDFDWKDVSIGTMAGFQMLGTKVAIEKSWLLSDRRPDGPTWHNGVSLFACSKMECE